MNKIILLVCIILTLAVGCAPRVNTTNDEELRPLAEEDYSNALSIADALMKAFADQQITTEEKDQELVGDSGLGKILIENEYMDSLPVPEIQEGYVFYVSISNLGSVTVKAGDSPETAQKLYPRPGSFEHPYSVLNK